jgi:DNA primase
LSRIPDETIREIRDRVDIVELIGRYVELKKAGRDYKACCVFHNEKTPSFHVSPSRQMFHCFGCQAGGDAVAFLMQHETLTFPEAVRTLARECGVEIAETDSRERGASERAFAANEVAQELYRKALASPEGADARAYLDARQLDGDSIERFGVGFAPDRWDAVSRALATSQIPQEDGLQAGLLAERREGNGYYDRMRGRVTFPIYDVRRRIIGFGGRALGDQEPKYLNTPESTVFHKRQALYGFPFALESIRRANRAIVCEGYFDRISLHRADLGEALATCGTSLTPEHARELRRRTRRVVLLFDGDKAGRHAAVRALEVLLPEGLRVFTATLPQGEDPDTLLLSKGKQALIDLVDEASDALEVVIRDAAALGGGPAEQADAVASVAPLIALVNEPVERLAWARKLAMATGTHVGAVQVVVRESGRHGGRVDPEKVSEALGPPAIRRLDTEERNVRRLAALFFHHPELARGHSLDRIEGLLPEGPWQRLILQFVEAAKAGCLDESGHFDSFRLEERLDPDERARVREVAIDEAFLDGHSSPSGICEDLIDWFAKRRRSSEGRETTRGMDNSEQALQLLITEKQRQLEARRAALSAKADRQG